MITSDNQTTLPVFPNGFDILAPDTSYYWQVETHGELGNVDDFAGPTGYMGDFNLYEEDGYGPARSEGSYTISAPSWVTTAP